MILAATESNINQCVETLLQGDVISFPTETVYGLGALATREDAVAKIFQLKDRPSENPLIVHGGNIESILEAVQFSDEKQKEYFKKLSLLWPGPLTIVLPKSKSIPAIASASLDTIGVRIPNHPIALTLLNKIKKPIAAPSANKSNYISPTTPEHVEESFPTLPILDGGECEVGIESTIISLADSSKPTILRHGAISREKIAETLSLPIDQIIENSSNKILSPGMMKKHYSPATKTAFISDVDIWSLPPIKIGLIAFSQHLALEFDFHAVMTLSARGDHEEIARRLYAALREMDTLRLDLILVDSCIESGLGTAIMDRLKRAITK